MTATPVSDASQTRSPTVIIVGGGLAGLAAAVALAPRGFRVTLLESRQRLGGRAGSFIDLANGQLVDACQHVSMGVLHELRPLLPDGRHRRTSSPRSGSCTSSRRIAARACSRPTPGPPRCTSAAPCFGAHYLTPGDKAPRRIRDARTSPRDPRTPTRRSLDWLRSAPAERPHDRAVLGRCSRERTQRDGGPRWVEVRSQGVPWTASCGTAMGSRSTCRRSHSAASTATNSASVARRPMVSRCARTRP